MTRHDVPEPFERSDDADDPARLVRSPGGGDFDGDDEEETPFHLPMLGLYADLELGSGAVQLPDEFLQADAAVQRRILGDWQRGLAEVQARLAASVSAPVRIAVVPAAQAPTVLAGPGQAAGASPGVSPESPGAA